MTYERKRFDWGIFWTAVGVVFTISTVIITCYVNIRTDLTVIKTVLITKGIMHEAFANQQDKP
ncbi:MAG TPA: hypothetical protein VIJ14_08015 [Rhabdochlamydiaceae bacterium]